MRFTLLRGKRRWQFSRATVEVTRFDRFNTSPTLLPVIPAIRERRQCGSLTIGFDLAALTFERMTERYPTLSDPDATINPFALVTLAYIWPPAAPQSLLQPRSMAAVGLQVHRRTRGSPKSLLVGVNQQAHAKGSTAIAVSVALDLNCVSAADARGERDRLVRVIPRKRTPYIGTSGSIHRQIQVLTDRVGISAVVIRVRAAVLPGNSNANIAPGAGNIHALGDIAVGRAVTSIERAKCSITPLVVVVPTVIGGTQKINSTSAHFIRSTDDGVCCATNHHGTNDMWP
jgi:hypothetical protein